MNRCARHPADCTDPDCMDHGTPNPVDVLEHHVLRPLAALLGRTVDEEALAAARAHAGELVDPLRDAIANPNIVIEPKPPQRFATGGRVRARFYRIGDGSPKAFMPAAWPADVRVETPRRLPR